MMDGTHYDVYLKAKEDKLNEILKEDAKTLFDERIHLVGMQNPYYYRYKCNAAFGWNRSIRKIKHDKNAQKTYMYNAVCSWSR